MKKSIKIILTLALSIGMILGNAMSVSAVTSESLNNLQSEYGSGRQKVSGDVNAGSFSVLQNDANDSIKVYKIASVVWDDANKTYKDAAWESQVSTWLTSGAGRTSYGSYTTPELLGKAAASVWTSFYNDMLKSTTEGNILDSLTPVATADAGGAVTGDVVFNQASTNTVSDSTYQSLGLTKGTQYVVTRDDGTQVICHTLEELQQAGYNAGDSNVTTEACYVETVTAIDNDGKKVTTVNYYSDGDVYSSTSANWEISNLSFGIYAVIGSNSSGLSYSPVVVSVAPEQEGPVGNWYLVNDITTNLKAGDIVLDKKINDKDADTVAIGDNVDFSIITSFPNYAERVTIGTNSTVRDYTLALNDDMSTAFNVDRSSFKLYYRTSTDGEWTEFENYKNINYYAVSDNTNTSIGGTIITKENIGDFYLGDKDSTLINGTNRAVPMSADVYTYLIASKATSKDPNFAYSDNRGGYGVSVFACASSAHQKEYQLYLFHYEDEDQQDTYYWYYYRDNVFNLLRVDDRMAAGVNLSDNSSYLEGLRELYSKKTGDSVNHSTCYKPDWAVNVFNISFNVGALKAWAAQNGNPNIQQLKVEYSAKVTGDAEVNSENNTNKATLVYESNSNGTLTGSKSDTVYAYTYGANVVKIDGDTASSSNPTYLAGAKFRLYKETDSFIGDTYAASMDSSTTADDAGTKTLSEYKAAYPEGDNYYYYTYTADKDGKLDNGAEYKSGDVITRAFALLKIDDPTDKADFEGEIISDATSQGVTVKGLNTGNYVLKETQRPSGYNALAEDMLFSIYKIGDELAMTRYAGSYKLFADDAYDTDTKTQTITDDDGVYKLNVLNYKGLTLPSTGGMGTLLFTIIGIAIMLIVLIVLLVKNKNKKHMASGFMALVLVSVLALTAVPQDVYAVTTVKLNTDKGTAVSGGKNTVDFKVNLKNKGDAIEVYQVGQMGWDGYNYSEPHWSVFIDQAIQASPEYSKYGTPEILGAADPSVQAEMLQWIYDNRATNGLQTSYDRTGNAVLSDDGLSYAVKGVGYGIYLIKATNTITGKSYSLMTVNAMPTQEGPLGGWYLKNDITATLKFSDIQASKLINGKDGDTVYIGEQVPFEITGEVPDYPVIDAEGNSIEKPADMSYAEAYKGYKFSMTDTMSEAFAYKSDNGVKVTYTTDASKDGATYNELPADVYTMLFDRKAASGSDSGVMIYSDNKGNAYLYVDVVKEQNTYNMTWYSYIPTEGTLTKLYENSSTSVPATVNYTDLITAYKAATALDVTSFTRSSQSNWTDLYNVTFDYARLKELGATYVRISYDADVTKDIVVGADTNTNEAAFFYQNDISGKMAKATDTAKAWTYGVKVVKTDGDTTGSSTKYLANAEFQLYKEAYMYVPNTAGLGTGASDYANYNWVSSTDGSSAAPNGILSKGGVEEAMDTLAKLDSEVDGVYYYRVINVDANECDIAGCQGGTEAHSHIAVYKLYQYTDSNGDKQTKIVSVADANGVTVKGLEPASYVLIETKAPSGYNQLTEALRFDINELDDTTAETYDSGSKKAFYSEEEVTAGTKDAVQIGDKYYQGYKDGIYPINVKNFAGLTLPSTGGMGTLIFTLLGIMIMFIAIVVIIIKRRKIEY